MMDQNHELLMEVWDRLKSHIPPKERLEVADILVVVFDEFNLISDELLEEDLDKELRAAARSHLSSVPEDEDESYDDNDSF
jgi:hypothetical protein